MKQRNIEIIFDKNAKCVHIFCLCFGVLLSNRHGNSCFVCSFSKACEVVSRVSPMLSLINV